MSRSQGGLMIQHMMGGIHVIEFMDTNVLDQMRIEQIRAELDALVEKAGQPKFVISFANVKHISSAVLGVMMSLDKKIKGKKGELRIAAVSPTIKQVFQLTKLDKMIKMYEKTDDALVKF